MKFEEVLPALREGRKITNRIIRLSGYEYIYYKDGAVFDDKGRYSFLASAEIVENDNWEIVEEKKKVKIRDLTKEQFKKYCRDLSRAPDYGHGCIKCPFNVVNCTYWYDECWINHKDLYSDKFLDQEIEIED